MKILDLSVDELVFPERREEGVIHTGGLRPAEAEALERLVDVMRERENM